MKLYVIRHGLTKLNKEKIVNGQIDEPLASEGIEQAKMIIPLIPSTVKKLYSSPLLRTRQTAEIINSELHLPLFWQPELAEIHMGSLAGKSWEEMEGGLELKKKHRSVQFDYRPYGGESIDEVKKRVLSFLKTINNKHSDQEVLIITHGGIIRVIQSLEQGKITYETVQHGSLLIFDNNMIIKNS